MDQDLCARFDRWAGLSQEDAAVIAVILRKYKRAHEPDVDGAWA